jgi:hypothetical protein
MTASEGVPVPGTPGRGNACVFTSVAVHSGPNSAASDRPACTNAMMLIVRRAGRGAQWAQLVGAARPDQGHPRVLQHVEAAPVDSARAVVGDPHAVEAQARRSAPPRAA